MLRRSVSRKPDGHLDPTGFWPILPLQGAGAKPATRPAGTPPRRSWRLNAEVEDVQGVPLGQGRCWIINPSMSCCLPAQSNPERARNHGEPETVTQRRWPRDGGPETVVQTGLEALIDTV